jgi:hypothetical protein
MDSSWSALSRDVSSLSAIRLDEADGFDRIDCIVGVLPKLV